MNRLLDSLETQTVDDCDVAEETDVIVNDSRINPTLSVNDNIAFTCEQDSAIRECNMSGSQDFSLYG